MLWLISFQFFFRVSLNWLLHGLRRGNFLWSSWFCETSLHLFWCPFWKMFWFLPKHILSSKPLQFSMIHCLWAKTLLCWLNLSYPLDFPLRPRKLRTVSWRSGSTRHQKTLCFIMCPKPWSTYITGFSPRIPPNSWLDIRLHGLPEVRDDQWIQLFNGQTLRNSKNPWIQPRQRGTLKSAPIDGKQAKFWTSAIFKGEIYRKICRPWIPVDFAIA